MRMSFKTNRMVNYIGTGFLVLVDKQRFLLTAAHNVCIIQGKKRIRAGAVRLFFGRNGEAEDALPCEPIIVTGDDFEIDECFDEYMGGSDYAVLDMEPYEESLPEQVFLIDFGMPPRLEDLEIISYPAYPGEKVVQTRRIELRSAAAALDDSEAEKKPVELPGFPRYTVWKAWCGFRSSASHTHLTYKNKENIGSSGGPVFYYGLNEKCYVSGIHVGYMTDIQSNMAIIANRCFPDVTGALLGNRPNLSRSTCRGQRQIGRRGGRSQPGLHDTGSNYQLAIRQYGSAVHRLPHAIVEVS